MIGSLRGIVLDISPENVVTLEVAGVGYRVTTIRSEAGHAFRIGSEAFFWVHTNVREDDISLFGFQSQEERACFEALLSAHGVGTSLALAILNVHNPTALRRAVSGDDVDTLCLVPGVGRKTAARLVIDLQSKLGREGPANLTTELQSASTDNPQRMVVEALRELGYSADEIGKVLKKIPSDGEVSDILKLALREIAGERKLSVPVKVGVG